MESPSNNELYHTGEESSEDGDESIDQNHSEGGGHCDDDDKNNAPTSHRKSSNKKGRATSVSAKELVKLSAKVIKNKSVTASNESHRNILAEEPTLPQPDFSNLKDHYTKLHCIAFNNHFFGKKCVATKCARQGKSVIAYTTW
jgi:hypothetical protein